MNIKDIYIVITKLDYQELKKHKDIISENFDEFIESKYSCNFKIKTWKVAKFFIKLNENVSHLIDVLEFIDDVDIKIEIFKYVLNNWDIEFYCVDVKGRAPFCQPDMIEIPKEIIHFTKRD